MECDGWTNMEANGWTNMDGNGWTNPRITNKVKPSIIVLNTPLGPWMLSLIYPFTGTSSDQHGSWLMVIELDSPSPRTLDGTGTARTGRPPALKKEHT